MQCNNCGQELVAGAEFCGNCGAKLLNVAPTAPEPVVQSTSPQPTSPTTMPGPEVPTQPATPATAPAQVSAPTPTTTTSTTTSGAYAVARQPKNGFSIASLVLGICSLLLFWFIFLAIPLGILALIFGFIGRTKGSKGMGLAGIIMGIFGIVASIIFIVFIVNVGTKFCKDNPGAEECKDLTTTRLMVQFSMVYKSAVRNSSS